MSVNSFIATDAKMTKSLQISRHIAEDYLDSLQDKLNSLTLKVEKRDLIPPAVAAYSRYNESGQIGVYESKVETKGPKDLRDLARISELPEDTLVILYSLAISKVGAEKAIDEGPATLAIWKHAIEVGLVILNDLFDEKYATGPSGFFDALKDMGAEAGKIKI